MNIRRWNENRQLKKRKKMKAMWWWYDAENANKKKIRNGRSANIENGMVKQKEKQKKKSIPDFSENKIEKKVTNVE